MVPWFAQSPPSRLESLELRACLDWSTLLAVLAFTPRLTDLSLAVNRIMPDRLNDEDLLAISAARQLRNLKLCNFSACELAALFLPALRTLDLEWCHDEGLDLRGCPLLESLVVDRSRTLQAILSGPSLSSLFLCDCSRMTTSAVATLSSLKKLHVSMCEGVNLETWTSLKRQH